MSRLSGSIGADNPRGVRAHSCGAGQFKAVMQQSFDFGGIGFGVLAADSLAGDVGGQLVQIQCNRQTLFASHLTIALDLLGQCVVRVHGINWKEDMRWGALGRANELPERDLQVASRCDVAGHGQFLARVSVRTVKRRERCAPKTGTDRDCVLVAVRKHSRQLVIEPMAGWSSRVKIVLTFQLFNQLTPILT